MKDLTYDWYRLCAFFNGMREFRSFYTKWYGDYGLQSAYDSGRDWAHALTFGRYR